MSAAEHEQAERALTQFYRETILHHSNAPTGFRASISATHHNEQFNPQCGDRITLLFRVEGEAIEAAAFEGAACAICMASASLLCAEAPGQSIADLKSTHHWLQQALTGVAEKNGPEALRALLGVRQYPSRIQCALLPWLAAMQALPD